MANDATLRSIVEWARDLAGLPKGGPVSADRWRKFANQGLSEVHYLLAEAYEDWLESTKTITLVADQSDYPLNTGNDQTSVYKPISADYVSGGLNYNIPRFMLSERNDRQTDAGWVGDETTLRMRIVGNVMRLQPAPSSSGTVTLKYIPAFKALEQDNEPVSQAIPQGWEEMAAFSAAWRGAQVEGDPRAGDLKNARDELGQRFSTYATDRHAGEPNRVNDRRMSGGRRLLYGY